MREDYFDLKNLDVAQKEVLSRFFPEYVTSRMTDWQKGSWLEIMHRSRFGRLTENNANELLCCKMGNMCTCLMATRQGELRLYVCNGEYVDRVRIDLLNGYALERLRQTLAIHLLPASVDPTEEEAGRRLMLTEVLAGCFEFPDFILA